MTARALRTWMLIHRWTSLVCTLFLLVICVTGLPLIFQQEITDLVEGSPRSAQLPENAPRVNLDRLVAEAHAHDPRDSIRFVFIDPAKPQVVLTLGPAQDASLTADHLLTFDARTGALLKSTASEEPLVFMTLMLHLHTDLFAGLSGALFMGFMGLLFVLAVVSGVVLYAPFMRKLDFGTVRPEKSRRIFWLDLHNLLAVVTLTWAFVVGLTGVINELSDPLFDLWRATDVAALMKSRDGAVRETRLSSLQAACGRVHARLPDQVISSVTFPTTMSFGSPQHYIVWTTGNRPLTSRLFIPVLVDAASGKVTAVARLPWYLQMLEISRPLHFGDYGGLPLKIIWAILDLVTIVVLGSGLYLWLARKGTPAEMRAARPGLLASEVAE